MRAYKSSTFLFALSIMTICCNTAGNEKAIGQLQDSVKAAADTNRLAPVPIILKEMAINTNSIIENGRFSKSHVLNGTEIKRLSLSLIDSTASGSEPFKYHLVDTLFSNARVTVVLIGREYTEENILWLATYEGNSNLIDRLMVFYDNSEGSIQVQSQVRTKEVEVTSHNDYSGADQATKKMQRYYIDEKNKFIKKL